MWCHLVTTTQLAMLDLQATISRRILRSANTAIDPHESQNNLILLNYYFSWNLFHTVAHTYAYDCPFQVYLFRASLVLRNVCIAETSDASFAQLNLRKSLLTCSSCHARSSQNIPVRPCNGDTGCRYCGVFLYFLGCRPKEHTSTKCESGNRIAYLLH